MAPRMPTSHISTLGSHADHLLLAQFPANERAERQRVLDQVPWSLPLMWETCVDFWTAGFALGQSWLCGLLEHPTVLEGFSVCLCLSTEVKVNK